MRIAIDTIPDDGVHVDVQGTEDWVAEAAATVLEVSASSVSGSLLLQLRGQSVRATGHLRASGPRTCERCGEAVELVLDTDVDLSYVPITDSPDGGSEVRLVAGDLDVGWYSNGALEVDQVVSEGLALALPPRIICADTAACDARVERQLGATPPMPSDSPFAALGKLV